MPTRPSYDELDHAIARLVSEQVEGQPPADAAAAWDQVARKLARPGRSASARRRLLWAAGLVAGAVVAAILIQPVRAGAITRYLFDRVVFGWRSGASRSLTWRVSPSEAPLPPPDIKDLPPPTVHKFTDLNALIAAAGLPMAVPSWLPAGWRLERGELVMGQVLVEIRLVYRSDAGDIFTITQVPIRGQMAGGMTYDADDSQLKDVTVAGHPGMLLTATRGYTRLWWQADTNLLTIDGKLSEDEANKVALSIRLVDAAG